jgi:hypothetical protein
MRPSLKNLSAKAHDAAAGSPLPAGQEPPAEDAAALPTTAERGSMRKRARRLGRLREVQLRELGALVLEMQRLGRENPELMARKAGDLLALDEELRGLRAALGERETVAHVVAAGVAGACRRCDTLLGRDDRFCPHCGLGVEEVYPRVAAETEPAAEPVAPAASRPAAEPVAPTASQPAAEPAAPPAAAAPPPHPPPPPPPAPAEHKDDVAPKDRGQTELTATAPPQP